MYSNLNVTKQTGYIGQPLARNENTFELVTVYSCMSSDAMSLLAIFHNVSSPVIESRIWLQ